MEITAPVLLEQFVATKKVEGKSPKTVNWYTNRMKHFIDYLGERNHLADFNLLNARAFIASLQERTQRYLNHPISHVQEGGLSTHTIHGYVRTIKAFGTWMVEEGFVSKHPFANLKRPKLPEIVIDVLTESEIAAITKSINPNTFLGSRMAVIFLLLMDTGIRATELITLKVEDTDLDRNCIKVKGKGNKERIVPFGNTTKKVILRYVTTFRPKCDNPYLILSMEGEPLTYDGLAHIVKRLGESVDIPRLHPHLLRHSFAVRYLMNEGDLMSLKMMLGHTSISVTQMYLHLAQQHIQVQYNKHSPMDRMNIKFNGKNGV